MGMDGTPEPKSSMDGTPEPKSGSEDGPDSKSGSEDGPDSKSGSEDQCGPDSKSGSDSDSMDGPGGDGPSPGQMDQCLRMIYCSSDDTMYSYADEMTEGETDGVSGHVVVSAILMMVA